MRQEFVGLLWVIEKGSLEHANLKRKRAQLVTLFFRSDLHVFPLLYFGIGINVIVTMSSIYPMQPTEIYMQRIIVGRPGLQMLQFNKYLNKQF